mgnify:CR=1 FL=1
MNNFEKHAIEEFKAVGWVNADGHYKDDMQGMICENVLQLLNVFSEQGHSGSSAAYALKMFERLVEFKCIGPLTGADSEWADTGHDVYQNKRCSSVFKDKKTGECYDIDGKVFWEWYIDEETGEHRKSYFTSRDSKIPVTFPYEVPDSPIYEQRIENESNNS